MKDIIKILLILLLFTGCTEDVLDNIKPITTSQSQESNLVSITEITNGSRIGEGDLIFFRNSLTTDNWLMTKGNVGRTHKAYNAANVAYIQLNAGLPTKIKLTLSELNSNGLITYKSEEYKHYKALVMFKDSTRVPFDRLTVYTRDTIDNFRFYPKGGVLNVTNSTVNYIEWRRDSTSVLINNDLRLTRYYGWVWNIYRNGIFFEKKLKEPTNILSNQFQPDHKN